MDKKQEILLWFVCLFVFFVTLHNAIYAVLKIEESVFFILGMIFGIVAALYLIYYFIGSVRKVFKHKRRK